MSSTGTTTGTTTTATTKRRSIVSFEKWLDGEIEQVKSALGLLTFDAEELARKRANQEVKLETLQSVKARLAPTAFESTEDEPTFDQIPQAQ